MTIITEEQYHSQPHTGCELVVKEVLDNDAKKNNLPLDGVKYNIK